MILSIGRSYGLMMISYVCIYSVLELFQLGTKKLQGSVVHVYSMYTQGYVKRYYSLVHLRKHSQIKKMFYVQCNKTLISYSYQCPRAFGKVYILFHAIQHWSRFLTPEQIASDQWVPEDLILIILCAFPIFFHA